MKKIVLIMLVMGTMGGVIRGAEQEKPSFWTRQKQYWTIQRPGIDIPYKTEAVFPGDSAPYTKLHHFYYGESYKNKNPYLGPGSRIEEEKVLSGRHEKYEGAFAGYEPLKVRHQRLRDRYTIYSWNDRLAQEERKRELDRMLEISRSRQPGFATRFLNWWNSWWSK